MTISEKAKVFMFVCIGLAALAVAANQWVQPVVAQVGDNQVVAATYLTNSSMSNEAIFVYTTNAGDLWGKRVIVDGFTIPTGGGTYFMGNIFDGQSVSTQDETLGGVKGMFR